MSKHGSMLALMIAGWASATPVAALARSGALDPTFGFGGRVLVLKNQLITPGSGFASAANAKLQPDGRIVVAAPFDTFGVVRLLPDGQLDPSFGTAGVVRDPGPKNANRAAQDLAIQPDGKIILVGSGESIDAEHDFVALARFNPDGSLDASFGVGGNVLTPAGQSAASANVVLLQPDGKIVIGGISVEQTEFPPPPSAILQRYNPDGSLDAGFGRLGKLVLQPGNISALALQTDGKILVNVGAPFFPAPPGPVLLVRVLPDGAIDPSHAAGTIAATAHTGAGTFQPDGRFVLAGTVQDKNDTPAFTDEQTVRFTGDGAVDPSFASPFVEFGQATDPSGVNLGSIALQADGKVIVGGVTPSSGTFSLVRLNTNGSLDQGFGRSGRVNTAFGPKNTFGVVLTSLVVQPDGRIVAVGVSDDQQLALARYLP